MPFSTVQTRTHQTLLPAGLLSVVLGLGTVALTGFLVSPAVAEDPASEMGVVTLYVGPERVDCVSVAPQTCYQIRYAPEDDYQLLYSDIRGFDYEPGYNYELRVLKTPVPNPPADASSINWTLVEVVSKTPAISSSRGDVCAIVTTMPSAADTDEMLALLDTDRTGVLTDLEAMSANMQRYDDEGYGWQNVIDSPDALAPQPDAWLIGALRMACED
jgi:hypothetical protein